MKQIILSLIAVFCLFNFSLCKEKEPALKLYAEIELQKKSKQLLKSLNKKKRI